MGFKNINCKLGTMKKIVDWVICPVSNQEAHLVTIQSDKRIARIDLNTKKGILSAAGRPYFMDLLAIRGATSIDVSDEIINELKAIGTYKKNEEITPGFIVNAG